MRYLRSKRGVRIKGLGDSIYLAWIPNYYGLIPPKLRYKHELNGDLEYIKSEGHIKAVGINSLVWCTGITVVTIIDSGGHLNFGDMYPFYIGVIGFMTMLDLVLVEATKWKVDKQRHANKS
jgi:hypothetical protein